MRLTAFCFFAEHVFDQIWAILRRFRSHKSGNVEIIVTKGPKQGRTAREKWNKMENAEIVVT